MQTNPVNPYLQSLQRLQPAHARPVEAQRPAESAQPVRQAAAPRAATQAAGLSEVEQQMIDRYFPASPQLSNRIYGPGRGAQTLNPEAVGSRLDLRG